MLNMNFANLNKHLLVLEGIMDHIRSIYLRGYARIELIFIPVVSYVTDSYVTVQTKSIFPFTSVPRQWPVEYVYDIIQISETFDHYFKVTKHLQILGFKRYVRETKCPVCY